MVAIKLKNVERFKDRYGKTRYYYRVGKGKRVAIHGEPGTDAFAASYLCAAKQIVSLGNSQERTFNALAKAYYASVKFLKTKDSSKRIARGIIDAFCKEHGHRIVSQMMEADVDMIIAGKANTPAAANNWLKYIRVLLRYAIRLKWITQNPAQDAEGFEGGEHHSWIDAELTQYEKRWPLGSRQRIAFDLFLYTGQRLSDVCSMPPSAILPGNFVSVKQEKTGAELIIPMHPNLIHSMNLWRGAGATILAKNNGKPYAVGSYGRLMADAIAAAGLPERCVTHGLRKAAARRLAEAGCSVFQIAAITGHKSIKELQRYTAAASQKLMAGQAIASLGNFKIA